MFDIRLCQAGGPAKAVRLGLQYDGSTVTWRREGTGPECWGTTFEGSTNGAEWIPLGAGIRSAHGWELATAFPVRSMIRARGFITGGLNNGSGWFAEIIHPTAVPPQILADDAGFGGVSPPEPEGASGETPS